MVMMVQRRLRGFTGGFEHDVVGAADTDDSFEKR